MGIEFFRAPAWVFCGQAATALAAPALAPFVDPLPVPRVLAGVPDGHGLPRLNISELQTKHRFHRDLPPTTVWAYNGEVPGPTIVAERGQALAIRWTNRLPPRPLLPVSQPPPMQGDCGLLPEARTTVHLHGAYVREGNYMDGAHNSDGYPDGWILPGQAQAAFYPNQQPAACLWYHDHALGCTARNVAAGLAGLYLLRDPAEAALGLPSGPQELPLLLQARSFRADGSLAWPAQASSEEVYGDVATVNGKIWPYLKVQARRYRFHLLNASTARIFDLRWEGPAGPAPLMRLVGGDGGLLEHPVSLGGAGQGHLVLGPGERMDVVVDFDRVPHSEWVLANLSRTDPGAAEPELPLVMQFRVGGRPEHGDPSRVPENLAQVQAAWAAPQAVRNIFYGTEQRPGGGQRMLLNNLTWGAPVAEMAQTGAVEQWNLINPTAEWHSFHIHSAVFKVLDRGDLAMGGEGSAATAWGGTQPRLDCESGLKDTVLLPPNTLTRILLRFGPYAGRYVYHCHMLEHEDDDMMRPYELSAAPRS